MTSQNSLYYKIQKDKSHCKVDPKKFEQFLEDLRAVCAKHEATIDFANGGYFPVVAAEGASGTSGYSNLEVSPFFAQATICIDVKPNYPQYPRGYETIAVGTLPSDKD